MGFSCESAIESRHCVAPCTWSEVLIFIMCICIWIWMLLLVSTVRVTPVVWTHVASCVESPPPLHPCEAVAKRFDQPLDPPGAKDYQSLLTWTMAATIVLSGLCGVMAVSHGSESTKPATFPVCPALCGMDRPHACHTWFLCCLLRAPVLLTSHQISDAAIRHTVPSSSVVVLAHMVRTWV